MITLSQIFDWIVTTSLRASLVVLAIVALQHLLRKKIGARARYALWLPVALVLLTPAFPESRWSVQTVFVAAPAVQTTLPPSSEIPSLDVATSTLPEISAASIDWHQLLPVAWLCGSAIFIGLLGFSHIRSLRRYARTQLPVSDSLRAEIAGICDQIGLRHPPHVWRSPDVHSPAVTALFRPLLLLPASFEKHFTTQEARLILQHELTHLKRQDLPLNALMCLLIVLHWFNPVLWLAFFKIRTDREAACDAQVLTDTSPDRRRDYGHALLKVESDFSPAPLSLGFIGLFQHGAALRHRIQSIANPHPTSPTMKLLTLAFIIALTFLGITRAATEPAPGPEIHLEAHLIEITGERNQPRSADAALDKILANLDKTTLPSGPVKALLDDLNKQHFFRQLNAFKSIDLMAVPRMITRSGQRSIVEVTREFLNPSGKPLDGPKVGVTLDVLPTLTRMGTFDLDIKSKIVEFDGFIDGADGQKKPVFNEREAEAYTTLQPGQTALIDIGSRTDTQDVMEEDENGKILNQHTDTFTRRAIVLITAQLAKPAETSAAPKAFTPGKSTFRPSDSIRIRQVQRSNGFMTVTADYELASTDSARLSLHITSLKNKAGTKTSHTQSQTVTRGKGTVILHHPDTYEGLPHLTFYNPKTGKAIGGLYFGTPEEAAASQKLDLSYMLEPTPEIRESKASTPGDGSAPRKQVGSDSSLQQYNFNKAPLGDVMRSLATDAGWKFFSISDNHPATNRLITYSIKASPLDALQRICHANGLRVLFDGNTLYVRPANDTELVGKAYSHSTATAVDSVLADIRVLLGVRGNNTSQTEEAQKSTVIYKPADNVFYVKASRQQHEWAEAYFKGLSNKK